jgi:heterodisulfide reductase subunit B
MRMAYYPGCSLDGVGLEFNLSTRAVSKLLGLELWEIPDWNCCGASAAHTRDQLLALALPARNLALAEQEGLDVAVPCAACFNRMKVTELATRSSKETKDAISELIELPYEASNQARNLIDVMANVVGLEKIKEKVQKPLSGLKVACYYGCLLVRPPEITQFDDPEDPMSMDNIVSSIGGEPVYWAYKVECCGASQTSALPKATLPLLHRIFQNAFENGADCLAVACPLCFINLDMRQGGVKKAFQGSYNLPVFYFTELMGLAFGISPKELGLKKHFVDPLPLLNSRGILTRSNAGREAV